MGLFPKLVVLGVAVLAAAVIWQWMHTVDIEGLFKCSTIRLHCHYSY